MLTFYAHELNPSKSKIMVLIKSSISIMRYVDNCMVPPFIVKETKCGPSK